MNRTLHRGRVKLLIFIFNLVRRDSWSIVARRHRFFARTRPGSFNYTIIIFFIKLASGKNLSTSMFHIVVHLQQFSRILLSFRLLSSRLSLNSDLPAMCLGGIIYAGWNESEDKRLRGEIFRVARNPWCACSSSDGFIIFRSLTRRVWGCKTKQPMLIEMEAFDFVGGWEISYFAGTHESQAAEAESRECCTEHHKYQLGILYAIVT